MSQQQMPNYYPPQPQSAGLAIASLVLSIIALVIFCIIYVSIPIAIAALVLGIMATKQAARGEASGAGMAKAGVIIACITIGIDVLLLIVGLSVLHSPRFQKQLKQIQQQQMQMQQQQQNAQPAAPTTQP